MIIKTDMKENTKANNLRLGAIYINANTGQPMRLITIVPCQGVWMETYDNQGYGELIKFDDVHYADTDEVTDYLNDLAVYTGSTKAPSYKEVASGFNIHAYERQVDVNGDVYVREDEDYLCRD